MAEKFACYSVRGRGRDLIQTVSNYFGYLLFVCYCAVLNFSSQSIEVIFCYIIYKKLMQNKRKRFVILLIVCALYAIVISSLVLCSMC